MITFSPTLPSKLESSEELWAVLSLNPGGLPGFALKWGWCCLPSLLGNCSYWCWWIGPLPFFLLLFLHSPAGLPSSLCFPMMLHPALLFEWKGWYLLSWLFSFTMAQMEGSRLSFYPWGCYSLFISRLFPSPSGCPSLSGHTKEIIPIPQQFLTLKHSLAFKFCSSNVRIENFTL